MLLLKQLLGSCVLYVHCILTFDVKLVKYDGKRKIFHKLFQSMHEKPWAERNGIVNQGMTPPEEGNSRGGSWRNREFGGGKRQDDDDGWRNNNRWRRDDEDEMSRGGHRRYNKSFSEDDYNLPEWYDWTIRYSAFCFDAIVQCV